MRASLKRFLQTGRLDGLEPGMTRDQIVGILGPPDDMQATTRRRRRPMIYLYGDVEICFNHFEPDQFSGISIELHGESKQVRLPAAYEVEDWDVALGMHRLEVEAFLRSHGLSFERSPRAARGTTVLLVVPGRVALTFDEEDRLHAFYAGPSA
jgi:hypothetical protein